MKRVLFNLASFVRKPRKVLRSILATFVSTCFPCVLCFKIEFLQLFEVFSAVRRSIPITLIMPGLDIHQINQPIGTLKDCRKNFHVQPFNRSMHRIPSLKLTANSHLNNGWYRETSHSFYVQKAYFRGLCSFQGVKFSYLFVGKLLRLGREMWKCACGNID